MKWIKTKDTLPVNNQRVITRDVNEFVTEFTYFDSLKPSWILRIEEWLDESDEWKLVDTDVPKETYLLLFNGNWTGVGKCAMVDDYNNEDGPLVPRWEDETSEFITPSPTHYMQLPKPPHE